MISEPILGIIMMCIMIFAIFIGFPVAFTLMALGVLFGFPSMGWHVFDLMVQRAFAVMNNDVLVSLPLFMLMGYVMERAGIMDRMFHSYRLLFGPLPGAIALATMFVGTVFGKHEDVFPIFVNAHLQTHIAAREGAHQITVDLELIQWAHNCGFKVALPVKIQRIVFGEAADRFWIVRGRNELTSSLERLPKS